MKQYTKNSEKFDAIQWTGTNTEAVVTFLTGQAPNLQVPAEAEAWEQALTTIGHEGHIKVVNQNPDNEHDQLTAHLYVNEWAVRDSDNYVTILDPTEFVEWFGKQNNG